MRGARGCRDGHDELATSTSGRHQDNFIPTFKIQGKLYHLLGALLPLPDADHQSLQIYFMGNSDTVVEVDKCCAHNPTVKRTIVQ
ncbi:hypothetical protein GWI33_003098 [Rhynchophorus ferrugineus]|uniref:Uncharacterized protein n=1 Tax=Rhynchophorus ferrugineus TaxID=354439 RepID=A0A834IJP2_RHYFE|nr:hypothetical protein GWI33_003098 [Rhynchophorus ferrugineus]